MCIVVRNIGHVSWICISDAHEYNIVLFDKTSGYVRVHANIPDSGTKNDG